LLHHANKEYKEFDLKIIGVMTKNREEWIVLEIANVLYGNTMAPMYENTDKDVLLHVLK
jgi:long-chain acyl-CoA synthetase